MDWKCAVRCLDTSGLESEEQKAGCPISPDHSYWVDMGPNRGRVGLALVGILSGIHGKEEAKECVQAGEEGKESMRQVEVWGQEELEELNRC